MRLFNKQDRISNVALFITSDRKNISLPIDLITDASARSLGETELKNKGIVYKFLHEGVIKFFVHNLKSPIDIIFASSDLQITHIDEAVHMEGMGRGMLVTSKTMASYVLEVPGGFTSKNNINIGDRISVLG